MEVKTVDQVELRQIREVDPDELRTPDGDRVLRVVEATAVDRVEVVAAVAVGVVAVHHQHELLRRRARLLRIDDEGAVEPLVDVLLQRRRVAVVELHPRRLGRELVGELLAGIHDLEDAVHIRRMDPVEVNRVRVRGGVHEVDPEDVVLGRANDGSGDCAVVGPRREEDAGRDLDLPLGGAHLVLAHPARLVRQRRRRVEQVVEVVGTADGRRVAADHGRVPQVGVAVHMALQRALGGFCVAVERQLAEHRGGDERGGACEQSPPGKFSHA